MKIGIDGTTLNIPFPCGVRHYSEQILASLAKIDKDNEYIIFSKKNVNIPQQKNFHLIKIPASIPILKRQFFITYFANRKEIDVFHCLEAFGPIFLNNLKVITTVHDLYLDVVYPKPKTPGQFLHRAYAEFIRQRNLSNSKHLIAVSHQTKKDLSKYLKKRGLRRPIKVIYEAPHKKFRVLRKKKDIEKNFYLTMGDFSPRKNIPRVLKAYSLLPKKIRNEYRLIIVISTNDPKSRFLKKMAELNISSTTDLVESPRLDTLVGLYNQAIAFLYPSLYEGFGLPILEAMESGCPVITSKLGATKEISGSAALLVNPQSASNISSAMEKVVTNDSLARKYIIRGFKRTKKFSWEKAARETLNLYKKVYRL